jgi:hypothetical protein
MEHLDTATLQAARFIFAAITGVLSAYLARRGGRNPGKWLCIGAILGFFGVLPIFFLPKWTKTSKSQAKAEPKPKVFYIDGPTDKLWYYLDPAHAQSGPMSLTAITAAWKEGKITPTTYIWHEELPEWKPLQDFIKAQSI